MKRIAALVVLLLIVASYAGAGTIARGTKSCTGTTAFGSGCVLTASELNADLDVLVTLVNGNIDNDNIDASAAITQGKIVDPELSEVDGYSDSTTEQDTQSSPGDFSSRTQATTLQKEVEQLRYKLAEACGSLGAERVNASGQQAESWIEACATGDNLLLNGRFTVDSDGDNLPNGWTDAGSGACARTAVASADGSGYNLLLAGGADNDGCTYTLANLREDTRYLIAFRAFESTNNFDMTTTGADATSEWRDADVDIDGATWEQYGAIIETDGTPTDIVLKFLCDGASCQGEVIDLGVYELAAGKRPSLRSQGPVSDYDTSHTCPSGSEDPSEAAVTVVVPDVGYYVKLTVDGAVMSASGNGFVDFDVESGTTDVGEDYQLGIDLDLATHPTGFAFTRIDYPASAGSVTYTVNCAGTSTSATASDIHLIAELLPMN